MRPMLLRGSEHSPPFSPPPQAPRCEIHSTPMTQVQGKRGLFWSCHQRNLDGSWCSYRPARDGAGSPTYGFSPALRRPSMPE